MIGAAHDRLDVRRVLGAAAVDLEPDLDVVVRGEAAAGVERTADLVQRALDGHVLRQAVGPHLNAAAADVRCQLHERPANVDLTLDLFGIGRVELARGAAAPDVDAGIGEAFFDLGVLLLAQVRFDLVVVRRSQFDR